MRNLIEEAISEHWGERCPDFETGCPCCRAWAEYDEITRLRAENERLRAAIEEVRQLVLGANHSASRYPKARAALGGGHEE